MPRARVQSARQLGAAVRAARERSGRSQAALAAGAGVARQWLVLLETGRLDNPTMTNVLKVLAALDLHLEVASGDEGDTPGPSLDELLGRK